MTAVPPPRPMATVTALPGAPLRTLDGRLWDDLTDFERECEVMKRRLRDLPPLPGEVEALASRRVNG